MTAAGRPVRLALRIVAIGAAALVAVFTATLAMGLLELDDASRLADEGRSGEAESSFGAARWKLAVAGWAVAPAEHTLGVIPAIGGPVASVADLARAGEAAARGGQLLSGAAAQIQSGGTLDEADPAVVAAGDRLDLAASRLLGSHDLTPGPVASLREDLSEVIDPLAGRADLAGVFTSMAGEGGDYLLVVQNPAEQRGTGGLVGAIGIVSVKGGRFSLGELRSDLVLPTTGRPVDAPRGFEDRYERFGSTSTWSTANASPHFPSSAEVLLGLYERDFERRLDGVIAIDPTVMAHALDVTGPVTASGVRLDPAGFLDQALVTAYQRDDLTRRRILLSAARVTWRALQEGSSAGPLLKALASAAVEGHVQVYSRHPLVQRRAIGSGTDGSLSAPSAKIPADYLMVSLQNARPNKLDFYGRTRVRYAVQIGDGGSATARLSLARANRAPVEDLPPYVTGGRTPGRPLGEARSWVSVFAGSATEMRDFQGPEGREFESGRERGRNVFSWFQTTRAGMRSRSMARLDLGQVLNTEGNYELHVEPQAGLHPVLFEITVNGLEILDGPLSRERTFIVDPGL